MTTTEFPQTADRNHAAQEQEFAYLYGEWLELRGQFARVTRFSPSDDKCAELPPQMEALFDKASKIRLETPWLVAGKIEMLEYYMSMDEQADNRSSMVMASIRADLEGMA